LLYEVKQTAAGLVLRGAVIVLGHDGWDVINDHSVSSQEIPEDDFEKIMGEVQEYANQFCE
jgi:hypothetical protein